jgi:hypothetical protein
MIRATRSGFLAALTPEQFRVVWEALQQYADNHEEPDDGSTPPDAQLAEDLAQQCAAEWIRATLGEEP